MERQMEPCQLIERSIIKKYRKELWTPFIVAVKRYELIKAGDKIAVCISGGKDSMLMAKLMQELQRHSDVPFELVFLVMDPGYNEINRQKIESNAELLHIPVTIFESNIFAVANNTDKNPCYLCARMRRGHLYSKARELGCPLSKLKKVRSSAELTKLLMPIPSVRTKRCLLRDMILLAAADHDLSDKAIGEIYEIGIKIGIKAEKIDDFFLWAARGLEWQVDGSRLIDEDI